MSDLLLEVPMDLALNRQTRSVFLAEEELRRVCFRLRECEAAVCEGDAVER